MNMYTSRIKERGAALIIGLIFLVIMSIMGLTSLQNVTIQERISGNTFDKYRAYQAAEIALASVEQAMQENKFSDYILFVTTDATLALTDTYILNSANWVCDDTTVAIKTRCVETLIDVIPNISNRPRVKIEYIDVGRDEFRITVWARGNGQADVYIQSIYQR